MNHLVYYIPLLSIIVSTLTAFANPLIDVSISDEQYREVYDFIDRMVAKKAMGGIVKNTRPYSRGESAAALIALAKKVDAGDVSLSNIERKRLTRLMYLFAADFKYPSEGKSVERAVALPRLDANLSEYLLQTRGETYQFGVSLEAGEIFKTASGGIDIRDCPSGASAGNWEGACQNLFVVSTTIPKVMSSPPQPPLERGGT